MRKRTDRVWTGLLFMVFLFAAGAEAQPPKIVNSFNGRSGIVVSASGDYSFALLSGTAAKTQLPGTTAYTDAANAFTANQSISGNLGVSGIIALPNTAQSFTEVSTGVITLGGSPFLHNQGTNAGDAVVGNTFVGQNAGNFYTANTNAHTVLGNTGIGYSALSSVSSGTGNTGGGYLALGRNTTGFLSTALGIQALFANETGTENTAIGADALELNVDGYNNVAIGVATGAVTGAGSNHDNIYIGNDVGAVENNTIRIGNNASCGNHSCQTQTFIAGISNSTVTGTAVVVDSNGQLGVATSSARFKYDVQGMDEATQKLLRLRPVTFRYKQAESDGSHPLQYGLVAEEVAEVYPELVQNSPDGKPYTVRYQILPAMLLNEFQKEHKQVVAQQEQIQALQHQLAQLAAQTRLLQTEVAAFRVRREQGLKIAAITERK